MNYILLQIDFSQAEAIQTYALGALVLVLLAGIVGIAKVYLDEKKRTDTMNTKAIDAMGELREVIRNNTEVLNQVKGKL
jgi:hypothetical protein